MKVIYAHSDILLVMKKKQEKLQLIPSLNNHSTIDEPSLRGLWPKQSRVCAHILDCFASLAKTNGDRLIGDGIISFDAHKAEMMKDHGFKKAYDDLELEFTLINAILDQRIKNGVTQKELAERVGTKQSAIARFESGTSNPTLAFVKKLSEALDLRLTITH